MSLRCLDCEAELDVDIDDQRPPRSIFTDRSDRPDPDVCPETASQHLPSPAVTDTDATYGAVTGGNGRSPLPCPTCGLPTWDGLHATGHRECFMNEVPGV